MSTFTLTFDTDNAYFRNGEEELAMTAVTDVLSWVSVRLKDLDVAPGALVEIAVRDGLGNRVGTATIEEDDQ